MKPYLLYIVFVTSSALSMAMPVQINSTTCNISDVRSAIDAADYGAKVLVPGEHCTWNESLVIKKGITLRGHGKEKTKITFLHPSGAGIVYSPDRRSIDENIPFKISGFNLDGGNSTTRYLLSVNNPSTSKAVSKVMIHDNSFTNAGTGINVKMAVWGVAYDNEFIDCLIPFRGMGDDRNSWDYWWESFGFGNANSFFFEDNIVRWTHGGRSGLYGFMEIGQGGRGVIRYNTWDMTDVGGSDMIDLWDIHGNQASDNWGGIGSEWYGNLITNDTTKRTRRLISLRGGKNLVFFNLWEHVPGSKVYANVWDSHADSLTPIDGCDNLEECVECSRPQHVLDTYLWSNLDDGTEIAAGLSSDACGVLHEDKEFFNRQEAFDSTKGVGCGPLNMRPEVCKVGVGYFATEQSCTDIGGKVGARPKEKISGTLYQCLPAGGWVRFFEPFIYPHPLREEGTCGFEQDPHDGFVSADELIAAVDMWKKALLDLPGLMGVIYDWKHGCIP